MLAGRIILDELLDFLDRESLVLWNCDLFDILALDILLDPRNEIFEEICIRFI